MQAAQKQPPQSKQRSLAYSLSCSIILCKCFSSGVHNVLWSFALDISTLCLVPMSNPWIISSHCYSTCTSKPLVNCTQPKQNHHGWITMYQWFTWVTVEINFSGNRLSASANSHTPDERCRRWELFHLSYSTAQKGNSHINMRSKTLFLVPSVVLSTITSWNG